MSVVNMVHRDSDINHRNGLSSEGSSLKKNPDKLPEEVSGELGFRKYKMQDFVPFNMPMHIFNAVFLLGPAHIFGMYGFYISFSGQTTSPWLNFVFFIIYGYAGGIGVTAGSHRLWTHRCYKAKKPLQVMLMLMQTSALQYPVIRWVRDHRIHHKYTDTNADPHSASRGFWFSHMGWTLEPEHPDVLKKEKTISMDDFENDPLLQFQVKYYWPLVILTVFIIPMTIIHFLFPQSFFAIVCINYSRWLLMIHLSGCINSVAHWIGDRPYDKQISSVENKLLAFFTAGEAWHNYHHTFPWDYKTSELPLYSFNITTAFIDFMAYIGWAYDLKTVPKQMIDQRAQRTGDGSHVSSHGHHHNVIEECENDDGVGEDIEIFPTKIEGKVASWGWGDADMAEEAKMVNRLLHLTRER